MLQIVPQGVPSMRACCSRRCGRRKEKKINANHCFLLLLPPLGVRLPEPGAALGLFFSRESHAGPTGLPLTRYYSLPSGENTGRSVVPPPGLSFELAAFLWLGEKAIPSCCFRGFFSFFLSLFFPPFRGLYRYAWRASGIRGSGWEGREKGGKGAGLDESMKRGPRGKIVAAPGLPFAPLPQHFSPGYNKYVSTSVIFAANDSSPAFVPNRFAPGGCFSLGLLFHVSILRAPFFPFFCRGIRRGCVVGGYLHARRRALLRRL